LAKGQNSSLTSPAFFQACFVKAALQKCDFNKEVVQKLKFPNNSIIEKMALLAEFFKFCAVVTGKYEKRLLMVKYARHTPRKNLRVPEISR
jgi:hypothetical protein